MKDVLLKKLLAFGLSDKEARIYLALLELEVATAQEVAKYSGVNRSSAYVVIENLTRKGFVGISDDKKVRQYVAASPETLLYSADAAAKKQTDIKTGIETILPHLKALHKGNKHRPIVKIFDGENGAKKLYEDIFTCQTKILKTFTNPLNIIKRMPEFFERYYEEIEKRKIEIFAINPASEQVLKFYGKYSGKKEIPNIALIPEHEFKFSYDVGIYDNKITFISAEENVGILIENNDIANMLKSTFDLAWKEAKRLDKELKENLNMTVKK